METGSSCVEILKNELDDRKDVRSALEAAIRQAAIPEIRTLAQFFDLLTSMLTEVPTQRTMSTATSHFHYIIDSAPGNSLNKDKRFRRWMVEFAKEQGSFCDTTESAKALDTFINAPEYHIGEYDPNPSGWLTFNQFFARKLRPGKRPVADLCNDEIIVSATDSVYLGCWPIDDQAKVVTKGVSCSVIDLLDGSPYQDTFRGGIFTHSYLDINDYHRYHVPVGGIIREARTIPGNVFVDIVKNDEGDFTAKDDIGFQFSQTRGVVIIESVAGLVAVLPVGMGHTSSVNLTAEVGARLVKGEEFGYFCNGGSDMIMLFQNKVKFTATPGTHYKQGEKIGQVVR
jgi:phosphatidylserine decarboxylase